MGCRLVNRCASVYENGYNKGRKYKFSIVSRKCNIMVMRDAWARVRVPAHIIYAQPLQY